MKTFSAALLVVLAAGCSNMEMRTSGSDLSSTDISSATPLFPNDFKKLGSGGTVIDPRTGHFTPYHGG